MGKLSTKELEELDHIVFWSRWLKLKSTKFIKDLMDWSKDELDERGVKT